MEERTWTLEEIKSLSSGAGWWVKRKLDLGGGSPWFEPVAAFVLATIKNPGDHKSWEVVFPATAAFLKDQSFHVAMNNLRIEISEENLNEELYHETQFEILGEKLRSGESGI